MSPVALVCCAALLGVAPSRPEATTPREDSQSAGRVVVGVIEGDEPYDDPALADVLAAVLASRQMSHEVATLPGGEGQLHRRFAWAEAAAKGGDVRAAFWIEPAARGHRFYMFNPRTDRYFVRALDLGGDPDTVLESFGILVGSYLTAAEQDEAPPDMEPVEPPEPPRPDEPDEPDDPPPPPPPPEPRARIVLGAEYLGGNLATSLPWHNGIGLRVGVELPVGVLVRVRPGVYLPGRVSGSPRLSVLRVPIAVEAGYRFRRDAVVQPQIGAAAVVEAIAWTAEDGEQAGEPIEARSGRTARVALGPLVGVDFRVWRGLGLHLHARADVWVVNIDLVTDEGGARPTRLRGHPVGATVAAGLHYAF